MEATFVKGIKLLLSTGVGFELWFPHAFQDLVRALMRSMEGTPQQRTYTLSGISPQDSVLRVEKKEEDNA